MVVIQGAAFNIKRLPEHVKQGAYYFIRVGHGLNIVDPSLRED